MKGSMRGRAPCARAWLWQQLSTLQPLNSIWLTASFNWLTAFVLNFSPMVQDMGFSLFDRAFEIKYWNSNWLTAFVLHFSPIVQDMGFSLFD